MKPLFTYGQPVWPSQEWANKSGEIEMGFVVGIQVQVKKPIYIYTVAFRDGFNIEVEENRLSATRPLPPNPNDLFKKII